MVVRGRYSKLLLTVMGFPDHDGPSAAAQRAAQSPLAASMQGLLLPELSLPQVEAASASASAMFPNGLPILSCSLLSPSTQAAPGPPHTGVPLVTPGPPVAAPGPLRLQGLASSRNFQLPLPSLPPPFARSVCIALDYYEQVCTWGSLYGLTCATWQDVPLLS